ncbi:MAG: phosphonate ABC transporter, permease protein PhnE, partial [Acidobacteriota bacterium]
MNQTARARPFEVRIWARAGWIALAAYVIYAASRLEITWARFVVGLDNGAKFIARMLPPNIAQP